MLEDQGKSPVKEDVDLLSTFDKKINSVFDSTEELIESIKTRLCAVLSPINTDIDEDKKETATGNSWGLESLFKDTHKKAVILKSSLNDLLSRIAL